MVIYKFSGSLVNNSKVQPCKTGDINICIHINSIIFYCFHLYKYLFFKNILNYLQLLVWCNNKNNLNNNFKVRVESFPRVAPKCPDVRLYPYVPLWAREVVRDRFSNFLVYSPRVNCRQFSCIYDQRSVVYLLRALAILMCCFWIDLFF